MWDIIAIFNFRKTNATRLPFSLKFTKLAESGIQLLHYASEKSEKITSRIKITSMPPWYIKRNNVISQARGLFPSKTPAASPIINFLSLSKGQQPRISNPKLKAHIWHRYAYAKVLNIIAHCYCYPLHFGSYQFPV